MHAPAEGGAEGEGAEAAEADTANWVQCAKCQAWRVVPDEFWPDIDAAGDEDWFCNVGAGRADSGVLRVVLLCALRASGVSVMCASGCVLCCVPVWLCAP